MEKIFTNKKIWKKIVVAILLIMAFQFLATTPIVHADDDSDAAQDGDNLVWKGILARPITSLVISVGDGIINVLHSQIMGQEKSLQVISMGEDPGWFWAVLGRNCCGHSSCNSYSFRTSWNSSNNIIHRS